MEKTYYRRLSVYPVKGVWRVKFEFADEVDGFFMPMTLEADTEQEVMEVFHNFVGQNSEAVDKLVTS